MSSVSPPVPPGESHELQHPTIKQPSEFRDDEHSIGCVVTNMLAQSIWGLLLLGRELSVAFELLSKRGRGSLFPTFLATYAPVLDRKAADRYRNAYICFKSLLPIDEDRTDCPEVERFRLTAIYRLCRSDASEAHRQAALALAQQGVVVSEQMATSLVKGDAAKTTAPRLRKHTINLENGTVEVRLSDGNIAAALQHALAEVMRKNSVATS